MSTPPSGPNYSWQPGDYKSAPTYGQPPRKSRAGLIIVLIVLLALVALGAIGVLAYRLVSDSRISDKEPGSAASAPAGNAKPTPVTRPTATRATVVRPTTARPSVPSRGAAGATDLARRFVIQLNANNSKGAAAFACKGSEQLIPLLMRTLVGPPTKLTTGTPTGQAPTFVIPLSGTSKGAAVTGVLVINQLDPAPLCVRAFQITTTR
ncbi:hypothetical protein [Kribbella speibonae]|uniref:Uncharacterized protein n=1 Tax=Kribbella speibonae TaxID=1572660 RepID=A0A4R0J218_9ACTN|nr:hypothetical protein [Kribbella speibonae]TCC40533.1 hypothetical protein E0H92_02195 [Kribbella speibonae]